MKTQENKFTVDYFINKFEAIPEDRWCVNEFKSGDKCCAQGFCMSLDAINVVRESPLNIIEISRGYPEWNSLITIFGVCYNNIVIASINNGNDPRYPQPTPKQRVLAALHDLKRKEQPKVKQPVRMEVLEPCLN